MAEENFTTRFKVDISDLKKNITEANKIIQLANAEFKAATSGMDDWSKSADGISKKLSQLQTVLDAQKQKLNSYEQQLERLEQAEAENGKRADELRAKYQQAAEQYGKNSAEAKKYETALNNVEKEQSSNAAAIDKMRITVLNQQAAIGKTEKEIRTYSASLDDTEDSAEDASKSLSKLSDGFTVMKGALASLIADGIKSAISALSDLVVEADKAYSSFQAQTGASTVEIEQFKQQMDELYAENYGDSMEDIANAMSAVAQSTKETDPSSIKELTSQVITLRDTFGYDFTESMRAVNMLMDQFGITGEEAFNLIVQGAQNGLDKNGDLLDSINEYAVHYKQLGYTADDFFNSLMNGTEKGAFSVDKLGDAMKEFGIRVKDTAESTEEAYELLGLDADKLRKKFAEGGESAQDASKEVIDALLDMDDEVKKNQAGVDLFGTMWEDLGEEAIAALTDTEGELSQTKQAMKELDKIKYSSLSAEISSLGREIKANLADSFQKQAVPAIQNFINGLKDDGTIQKFTDSIANIGKSVLPLMGEALKFVAEHFDTLVTVAGTAVGTFAALSAAMKISSVISTMTGVVKTLTSGVGAATAAQKLWNTALSSNPIGAVVTAVSLLVGGIGLLVDALADQQSETEKAIEKENEYQAQIEETTQNFKDLKAANDEAAEAQLNQIGYAEQLYEELQGLADASGRVEECDRTRAEFILGQLNEALGTEYTMTGNIIDQYDAIDESIKKVIETKKAQILLDSYLSEYEEAIKQVSQTEQAATDAYISMQQQEEAAQKARDYADEMYTKAAADRSNNYLYQQAVKAERMAEEEEKLLQEKQETYANQESLLQDYYKTINDYETGSQLILEGNVAEAVELLNEKGNSFKKAAEMAEESKEEQARILAEQAENAFQNAQLMRRRYEEGVEGVTKEMVETAAEQAQVAAEEFLSIGENIIGGIDEGADSEKAKDVGEEVVDDIKEGADTEEFIGVGEDIISGISEGAKNEEPDMQLTFSDIWNNIVYGVKKFFGIESPSKLFQNEIGKMLVQGLAVGVDKEQKTAINSIEELTSNMMTAAKNGIDEVNSTFNGISTGNIRTSGTARYGSAGINNIVFNQYNTSPKPLNRLAIYLDTKKALAAAKGA